MTESKKQIIKIKRWDNGEIIHSGEYESISECFNAAVKLDKSFFRADLRYVNLRSANLRYANLRYANLRYADLSYANLRYADLSYADLSSANLRSADLSSADLRSANLSSADLRSADLSSADLQEIRFHYCVGDGVEIYSMQLGEYKIAVFGDRCCGDCTEKSINEWLEYGGEELRDSDKKYLETVTKPFINMVIAMRESK